MNLLAPIVDFSLSVFVPLPLVGAFFVRGVNNHTSLLDPFQKTGTYSLVE